MKTACLTLLLLLTSPASRCFAQEVFAAKQGIDSTHNPIDSIGSLQQLENFLADWIPDLRWTPDHRRATQAGEIDFFARCDRMMDSLGVDRPYLTADLNADALTDLVLIHRTSLQQWVDVIFADSTTFRRERLSGNGLCTFPDLAEWERTGKLLLIYDQNDEGYRYSDNSYFKEKQVVVEKNTLLEVQVDTIEYAIDSFSVETSRCYGSCPSYRMSLSAHGPASLATFSHNQRRTTSLQDGNRYAATLSDSAILELTTLLNRIDIHLLEDKYRVNHSDAQTAVVTVHYDNGKVKAIQDYGMAGTLGLKLLYQKIAELHRSNLWQLR